MCIAHSFVAEGAGASQTLNTSEAVSVGPQEADTAREYCVVCRCTE